MPYLFVIVSLNIWNSLTTSAISADKVNTFKIIHLKQIRWVLGRPDGIMALYKFRIIIFFRIIKVH